MPVRSSDLSELLPMSPSLYRKLKERELEMELRGEQNAYQGYPDTNSFPPPAFTPVAAPNVKGLLGTLLKHGGLGAEIEKQAGGGGGGPGQPQLHQRGTGQTKPKGITAYHASPHEFDKFDLSKIGTGQGAATYGRGLYFAENPRVADSYWRTFGMTKPAVYDGRAVGPDTPRNIREAVAELRAFKKPGESARQTIDRRIGMIEHLADVPGRPHMSADYSNIIKNLKALDPDKLQLPTAHRYKVSIGAEKEEFLDWDKPLSKQSPYVKEAIDKRFVRGRPEMEEADYLGYFGSMPGGEFSRSVKPSELREAGIPGLRYLDQYSRPKGEGTSNLVLFKDSIIDILKKYGLAGMLGLGGMSSGDYKREGKE